MNITDINIINNLLTKLTPTGKKRTKQQAQKRATAKTFRVTLTIRAGKGNNKFQP